MGGVTIQGGVMSPRVVLGAPPESDELGPPLPQAFGDQPVWTTLTKSDFGWEFRLSQDFTTVIQPIAPAGDQYVYVAWVPSDARAGANPVFAALAPGLRASGLLAAYWDCELVDGTLRPLLDASPEADTVRSVWPWRMPADGDPEPGPYTGAAYIGQVIA